ncbi:MAG: hypothetical protein ABIR70_00070 [Bryobacteraceae bacterium]
MKLLLVAALLGLTCSAADVSIQADLATGAVHVANVSNEPLLKVYAGTDPGLPAMSGAYSWKEGTLTFTPRYPLVAGVQYKAVYNTSSILFALPQKPAGPATRLEKMYPSSAILPANQLKLYLEFSQPMARGGIWSHIHLLRDDGKAVELPFLEIDQELWSPDQRRLTVLFDPGRIKRGVTPQVEMGEVLEPGRSYTLLVDRELRDANNQPLAEAFRHQFRVAPSLREGIDLKKWIVTAPKAGSTAPLEIGFDRPLDWALLQHTLQVKGVAGVTAIDRDEMRWRFTPAQPWKSGGHELVVDMALEDLAGNRIGRPFDVDLFERVTERITAQTTTLRFDVR